MTFVQYHECSAKDGHNIDKIFHGLSNSILGHQVKILIFILPPMLEQSGGRVVRNLPNHPEVKGSSVARLLALGERKRCKKVRVFVLAKFLSVV
jgi:hypothetical protein